MSIFSYYLLNSHGKPLVNVCIIQWLWISGDWRIPSLGSILPLSSTRGIEISILCPCSQGTVTKEDEHLHTRLPSMSSATKSIKWWRESSGRKNAGQLRNSDFKSHYLSSDLEDEVSIQQANNQREAAWVKGAKPHDHSVPGPGRRLLREAGGSGGTLVMRKGLLKSTE